MSTYEVDVATAFEDPPRTCKQCKQEKPAELFVARDGKFTKWCQLCRDARWAFLSSLGKQRVKKPKEKRPTVQDLVKAATDAARAGACELCGPSKCKWCKADEERLNYLLEDYVWLAKKR